MQQQEEEEEEEESKEQQRPPPDDDDSANDFFVFSFGLFFVPLSRNQNTTHRMQLENKKPTSTLSEREALRSS